MASRGRIPPAYQKRIIQAPGMMRHGSFPSGHRPLEPLPPPELLENKIATQAAEIEQLDRDNHSLAASHVALRQELGDAHQEVQSLRAHIGSIQTESDIQIRVLLDKIAKMEADIKAGESVKKDLQQAHIEAQSLVKARQELAAQIQQASQELQKAHADVKSLPELLAELDSLRQEHQRLRATFEYEKGLNIEQVEQMKAMEKNLYGMVREMEMLRAEVLNAEDRACAPNPYGSGYINPDAPYTPPVRGGGTYVDGYGRPLVQMGIVQAGEGMIPYISSNATAPTVVGGAAIPGAGGSSVWRGPCDSSLAYR